MRKLERNQDHDFERNNRLSFSENIKRPIKKTLQDNSYKDLIVKQKLVDLIKKDIKMSEQKIIKKIIET